MQAQNISLEKNHATHKVSSLFLGSIFNESTRNLLARAKEAARNKDYERALVGYDSLLIREPHNLEFILDRLLIYINCKDCDLNEAMNNAQKSFSILEQASGSLTAKFYYTQARIYAKQKQYDKALLRSSLALELDEHNASFYVLRAQMNAALRRYALAVDDFHKVIELEPKNFEAYRLLSLLLVDKLQFTQALQTLVDAEQIFSDHHEILAVRNQVLERREEYNAIARERIAKQKGFCCSIA